MSRDDDEGPAGTPEWFVTFVKRGCFVLLVMIALAGLFWMVGALR